MDLWEDACVRTLGADFITVFFFTLFNKQSDVELVNFGLDGCNNLVINISIWCGRIGNSTVKNGHLNSKMHTNDSPGTCWGQKEEVSR